MKVRVPYYSVAQILTVQEEKKPWYYDILRLIEYGEFLEYASSKDKMLLRSLARRFFIFNEVVYKSDKALHLICVIK